MKKLTGKHFIAQPAIESHKILYSYQFGGGTKGGYVKSGDVIKVISEQIDVDTPTCGTDKLLHRITTASLLNPSFFIQLD